MDKTYERITIKDIAERCGVTANTVSRALRNDTKLSEPALKKVQQTAQEMGYIRNHLRRKNPFRYSKRLFYRFASSNQLYMSVCV